MYITGNFRLGQEFIIIIRVIFFQSGYNPRFFTADSTFSAL